MYEAWRQVHGLPANRMDLFHKSPRYIPGELMALFMSREHAASLADRVRRPGAPLVAVVGGPPRVRLTSVSPPASALVSQPAVPRLCLRGPSEPITV